MVTDLNRMTCWSTLQTWLTDSLMAAVVVWLFNCVLCFCPRNLSEELVVFDSYFSTGTRLDAFCGGYLILNKYRWFKDFGIGMIIILKGTDRLK